MTVKVVYLCNRQGPEATVLATLTKAGCEVECVYAAGAAWVNLQRLLHTERASEENVEERVEGTALVAETQAGASVLLELLREEARGVLPVPVLIVDREGNDISVAVRALRAGVTGYVLAAASPVEVSSEVQLFVERVRVRSALSQPDGARARPASQQTWSADWMAHPRPASKAPAHAPMVWDATMRALRVGDHLVLLTPAEGRAMTCLLARQGQTLSPTDLAAQVWPDQLRDPRSASVRLRPLMMHLRRKLATCPGLANRLVNVRGVGYMLTDGRAQQAAYEA